MSRRIKTHLQISMKFRMIVLTYLFFIILKCQNDCEVISLKKSHLKKKWQLLMLMTVLLTLQLHYYMCMQKCPCKLRSTWSIRCIISSYSCHTIHHCERKNINIDRLIRSESVYCWLMCMPREAGFTHVTSRGDKIPSPPELPRVSQ